MYVLSATINHSLSTPSMKNEPFHACQCFRTYLRALAAYTKATRSNVKGGRWRASLTLKATPCLHSTVFQRNPAWVVQRARYDPAKENRRSKHEAS